MMRLAWVFHDRGRLDEAQACAGDVVRLGELAGDADVAAEAYLLTALARIDLLQLTEGEALARAVLVGGGPHLVCARAVLARCLVEQQRSRELQLLPLDEEPAVADLRWRALVCESVTMALVSLGRTAEAGRWLRRATDAWPAAADATVHAILATAHLRLVLTTGDERLVDEAFRHALSAARGARAPMRVLQARVLRCLGLHGEPGTATDRDCCGLRRLLRCGTPLLRRDVARRTQEVRAGMAGGCRPDTPLVATLLELAQYDDDRAAVEAIAGRTREVLQAVRLDVVSRDAGPVSTLVGLGGRTPTGLGARVLDAGFAIDVDGPPECGVPIRLGTRLIGALVARWALPGDPPPDRRSVLECAAVVMAGRLDSHLQQQRTEAAASTEVSELLGVSAAIMELRRAVVRAARAPFAVLIEGESGVGKELVARALHQLSARRQRPFCDVNCAALPDDLLEAELFGHAKGAFTGAVAERPGLFEAASGGTLFLDEVAELSARAQAKLLRAVQQQEVRRVGESFARSVDVRVVAAANRSLRDEVTAGRFRADLLYRLDVIHLRIPPLRERPDDIAVLAQQFWRVAAGRVGSSATLAPATLASLTRYTWPGNVRELQNALAALAVVAPARGQVRPSLLPPVVGAASGVTGARLAEARDQFERRYIEVALARAAGNRTHAARALGLSRQGLLKSMTRLGLRTESA
jgi:DNA-binding NtrC family response regulator